MAKVGDIIAEKYRLVRLIGEGGMGQVFEAVYERLGKRVAVKILHPEYSLKEKVTARFEREARAAGLIGHPGIIDIYDLGTTEEDGSPFLIMECLQGQSLSDLLDEKFQLDLETTVVIACQVLSALSAAHQKGVVHRDLKPENVFLADTHRTMPEVKLLDFGISKFIEDELGAATTRLTKTGTVLGTPLYMSPEQARGERGLDHRVDIYAMGIMLYECLTGNLPFSGANYNDLLINIVTQAPMEPSALVDDMPEDIERIILKAMARERQDRYDSADEMLSELLPFVDEQQSFQIPLSEKLRTETQKFRVVSSPDSSTPTKNDKPVTHDTDPAAAPDPVDDVEGLDQTVQEERPPGFDESEPRPHAETEHDSQAKPVDPFAATRSPDPSRPSRLALAIIIAVVVIGVGMGLSAAILLGSNGGDQPMAVVETDDGDANARAASEEPDVETAPAWVEVRLSATPPAAKIFLDDVEIPTNPYVGRFTRDGVSHRIVAKAAGFQDRGVVVDFDQVTEVELELQPEPDPETSPRSKRPRTPREGSGDGNARDQAPGDDPWRDAPRQRPTKPPGSDDDSWRDTR